MSKRTKEQVRAEIGTEREALVRNIHALRMDVARVLPFAIGAALVATLVTRSKVARTALKLLWWLR
jgi:hypothetical protein